MITNNFLNQHIIPEGKGAEFPWDYNTFGYGFNVTFWSRLEIAYVCTLINGSWSSRATTYRQKIVKNQDRYFAAKLLALKEGEIWKWTPSIAIGVSDPVSGAGGDYTQGNVGASGNGFFNRYYIVATKHFYIGQRFQTPTILCQVHISDMGCIKVSTDMMTQRERGLFILETLSAISNPITL